MNTIHHTDDGVYMEIEVDGKKELRKVYLQKGMEMRSESKYMPELKDGEELLETLGGDMSIVTVRKVVDEYHDYEGMKQENNKDQLIQELNAELDDDSWRDG